MKNTKITQRFFPWKPKPGKPTYSIFIHVFLHCLQYNIHIGSVISLRPNQIGIVNENVLRLVSCLDIIFVCTFHGMVHACTAQYNEEVCTFQNTMHNILSARDIEPKEPLCICCICMMVNLLL
jgi:hypothetical protein